MPITPIDCSNMIIYKIQHNDKPELLYIGSTTNFKMRKSKHKAACNKETSKGYNLLVYKMIRNNGGWDNFTMIQIKEFPCNNRRESEAEEYKLMHELKASMNVCRYTGEQKQLYYENNKERIKEYRETNKEHIIEKSRDYYEINKDIIKIKSKEYRCTHREQIHVQHKEYRETNKSKIQEADIIYRNAHKDNIKEGNKKYREANDARIKELKNTKFDCACGGKYTHCHKALHFKGIKHLKYFEENPDVIPSL